jgi:hypothetical protein
VLRTYAKKVLRHLATNKHRYQPLNRIELDRAQPNSIAGLQLNHDLFTYTTLTGLSSSIRREII